MNYRLPLMWIVCSALLLAGCSPRKPANAITGMVGYRSVVELPGKAQLQLLLTDVSAEGSAPEIATANTDIKQMPYQYSLPYDAAAINQSHRYTISARIRVDGVLKYATDSAIEVLTQGKDDHANFAVIAVGANETGATTPLTAAEIFQGEIRNGSDITLYRAGLVDGHITWLEEDHSNGTPTPAHNSYEFKGALLIRYRDNSPVDIVFDDSGKPKSVIRDDKTMDVTQAMNLINAARNRASLLRADALSKHESQAHRKATKNDVKS